MNWRFWSPTVRIGQVPPEEEEPFLHIVCQSFNIDLNLARPYFYDDPYYAHNQRLALWIEENGRWRMVSVLTAIPLQMWIGERVVAGVGVAGVATHPLYRRRGYAGQLLQGAIRILADQAVPMAVLQAFDPNFYRRHGWETVGTLTRLRIEPSRLTPYPIKGVRRAEVSDYDAIVALHQQVVPVRTGMLVRHSLRWDYLLWNLRNKWVYVADNQLEGYLIHDFLEGGWVLRVRELVWRTERARQALLGWLARNTDNVRHIEFAGTLPELHALGIAPLSHQRSQSDEPLMRYEVWAGFMARPILPLPLVQGLLDQRPVPDGFVPFGLVISDKVRRANETLWVTESAGLLRVVADGDAGVQVRIPLEVLAQMVFGTMPATEICWRRRIALPETVASVLDALFPSREPCLRPMDFF